LSLPFNPIKLNLVLSWAESDDGSPVETSVFIDEIGKNSQRLEIIAILGGIIPRWEFVLHMGSAKEIEQKSPPV
jgi:hypothetical protein